MLKERKQQLRKYLRCDPQGSGLGRKLVSTELPSLALTQGWGVRWTLLSWALVRTLLGTSRQRQQSITPSTGPF